MPNIVLIGPVGVGKSTQAILVSNRLNLEHVPMDNVRFRYYEELGYSKEEEVRIKSTAGLMGIYWYWKPFEVHAIERLLDEREETVIDFGAGHSAIEDASLLERAEAALRRKAVVVLLLPSDDVDESIRILRGRRWNGLVGDFDFHDYLVKHPANYKLADVIIYTKGRSPDETCEEIIQAIHGQTGRSV
jgi:shikimate kinase